MNTTIKTIFSISAAFVIAACGKAPETPAPVIYMPPPPAASTPQALPPGVKVLVDPDKKAQFIELAGMRGKKGSDGSDCVSVCMESDSFESCKLKSHMNSCYQDPRNFKPTNAGKGAAAW